MRMFIRGAVALVILAAAYWGWALVGAAELASAASRGDAEAVMERVDLQALIRSLSSQISRAYLDQNPQLEKLPSVRRGVVLNGAAAEMLSGRRRRAQLPSRLPPSAAQTGRAVFPHPAFMDGLAQPEATVSERLGQSA